MTTERPDIREVLIHYGVQSTKRKISCLLHEDRTPSCSINYDTNRWKCFSCGESGDSWALIMTMEGLDFAGAKEFAETTLGLTAGGAGGGSQQLYGSSYGGGRKVSVRKGDRPKDGGFVPSWRRR